MNKKFIQPIIIGIIVVLYFAFMLFLVAVEEGSGPIFIFFSTLVMFMILTMIHVVRQRLKEIKEGEEDDISKY